MPINILANNASIIFLGDEAWYPGGLALGCSSAGGQISNLTLDVVKRKYL